MNAIESTREELLRTTGRMLSLVSDTPDDRLFWKPSPRARSIAEIVAHSAHALGNIAMQMRGTPFPIPTSAQANQTFLEHDSGFSDRAELLQYFQSKCDDYVKCLDSFRMEDLDRMVTMPFGLGEAPLSFFMTAGHSHTLGHVAQIEYIQTIYGDHDWHAGF